ncbi:hypothetical protein [Roseateles chitosanitabidus]|uniref:hypothetical protein n=1 Tax=Roseateles chitosanitabidus TaxID=65048 RepID=UPI000835E5D3|nr:hypothetical protein [Roseateles chitosanitabidus]
MTVLRVGDFLGAALAPHPKQLPDSVGVVSLNQKLGRGDLRPLRAPVTRAAVPAGRKSIYRMGRDIVSDTNYWLSWPTLVSVARGYNTSENGERTYYTGDGFPKWTDNTMALGATPPTAWRALGLPAPASAPTLAASGGSSTADLEDRAYVYTYVSDHDEESGPSPAGKVKCRADDTVAITSLAAAPAGSYGINRIRVYRTETGSSGQTAYFFLREIASSSSSTSDDNRALGEVLPSLTWVPAPGVPQGGALNITEPTLQFLTPLWNGMMAGISGREIRFCEPYIAYAWPMQYGLTPADVTPVAMAAYGSTLVVATNGRPVVCTGGSPDAMDESPVEFLQACVSPASMVSVGHGVAWASPDGLAYLGAAGPQLLTARSLAREDWQALAPETIIGAFFEGRYYGFYQVGGVKRSFMIDPAVPTSIYFSDIGADAVYVDDMQDAMFVLNGTSVQRWDAGAGLAARFRSKVFEHVSLIPPFTAGKVIADAFPVTVRVFDDRGQVAEVVVTSPDPFRLPGDQRTFTTQVEIETSGPVQGVALAHSMEEFNGG